MIFENEDIALLVSSQLQSILRCAPIDLKRSLPVLELLTQQHYLETRAGLGMDALVTIYIYVYIYIDIYMYNIICSWNANVIMVWANVL